MTPEHVSIYLDMLEALKAGRRSLAVAVQAAMEDCTEDDINSHRVIKQMDDAIRRATGVQS
jgi:hypothetical protein